MPKFKVGDTVFFNLQIITITAVGAYFYLGTQKRFKDGSYSLYGNTESPFLIETIDSNYEIKKEPLTITRYVNVYKNKDKLRMPWGIWFDREDAISAGKSYSVNGYLDTVEIIYTEKE